MTEIEHVCKTTKNQFGNYEFVIDGIKYELNTKHDTITKIIARPAKNWIRIDGFYTVKTER